jgi:diguanylate cyclase (GGDEF)-like protein/PAS domain S-box-containing protein
MVPVQTSDRTGLIFRSSSGPSPYTPQWGRESRVSVHWNNHVVKARPSWRIALPLVAVGTAGLISAVLPPYGGLGTELWFAGAMFVLALTSLGLSVRRDRRTWVDPVAPFVAFPFIALVIDLTGGAASAVDSLVALPILWLAMTGTRVQLYASSVLTAATFVVPILVIGPPSYPAASWRLALVWTAFAVLVAPVVQRLVLRLELQTHLAQVAHAETENAMRALELSEAQWRVLVDNLPDTTVLMLDEDLRIKVVAGAGSMRQGLASAQGMLLDEMSNSENMRILEPLIREALAGREAYGEVAATATGEVHEVVVTPLPEHPYGKRALALGRNVSAARERERALLRANERSERLFADAPHGLAVLTPEGGLINVNAALCAITGRTAEELHGEHLSVLGSANDGTLELVLSDIVASDSAPVNADCVLRNRAGHEVHVVLTGRLLRGDDSADDRVLINVVDVSERRRYEERLAHLADHDVLTGLPNRRRFDAELQRHLEHCRRYGPSGALLLLDLDNFKQVNDMLGHGAGDQLLISTAGLLQRELRATDVVARLGGDEFAILLTQGDRASAEVVAGSIVERIRDYTATLDGIRRRVSASVGVVTVQAAREHPTDILALADMTMYDAKEAGRNRYAVLEEDIVRTPRSGARFQWQTRIEQALEEDLFVLHLQPITDLRSGNVTAAEVLIRLRHGDTLIPPAYFLYVAERAGLIPDVDAWVIRNSIAMLAELRSKQPDFRLEVNLSGHSIGNLAIEETIVDALHQHRVDPAALILEITETAAVADVALAREFAERMTARGCKFALDDFGAGFGSFYYLKHLLFDYVKIDGEFVAGSHRSSVDRTILRSIVGIAQDLGKQTVAEFVTEPAVLEVVRDEGVDHAQGYLIGRPLAYDEFVAEFMAPA